MSKENFGVPVAEGWTLIAHIQAVSPDGVQRSLTSHEINGLDNETTDAGAEALVKKVIDQIHEWQDLKKNGYAGKS